MIAREIIAAKVPMISDSVHLYNKPKKHAISRFTAKVDRTRPIKQWEKTHISQFYERQKIVESLEKVGDLVGLDYGGEKLE